jgi:hypothetical protein
MSDRETETVTDYNGAGEWSLERVRERHATCCEQLGLETRGSLMPRVHREGSRTWIYPVMDDVILGIEAMDPACIALGIDLIETDALMPFGKILKANAARALRRSELTEAQKERIRRRIVSMLVAGIIPHELVSTSNCSSMWASTRTSNRLKQGLPARTLLRCGSIVH